MLAGRDVAVLVIIVGARVTILHGKEKEEVVCEEATGERDGGIELGESILDQARGEYPWPLIGRNRSDVIGRVGNIDPFGQLTFTN
jgi:hypothetical protein